MDVSGEHSGDVINTSSTDNYDTDPDSDTLTVTAIRTGSVEGSGTSGSVGSALTGTYGNLTIKFKWFLYLCCCRKQYNGCTRCRRYCNGYL